MEPKVLTVAYDYNQLYIYDAGREFSEDGNEYLDALDDMNRAGLTVGVASRLVDVLMPRQENFAAAVKFGGSDMSISDSHKVAAFYFVASGLLALVAIGFGRAAFRRR